MYRSFADLTVELRNIVFFNGVHRLLLYAIVYERDRVSYSYSSIVSVSALLVAYIFTSVLYAIKFINLSVVK
jgi:hypothetical protein